MFKVSCDLTCVDHIGPETRGHFQGQSQYCQGRFTGNKGKQTGLMKAINPSSSNSSPNPSPDPRHPSPNPGPNPVQNDNGSSPTKAVYAVKRIARERSLYDSPLIYDVFTEVSSLEILAGNRGVCELIDFGVQGVEYWMVMEAGKMDLLSWRNIVSPR